jgi:PAS domain S-box-containing protein
MNTGKNDVRDQDYEALEARCARFEGILDMADGGLIVVDRLGGVEYVNRMISDLTGFSKDDICSQGVECLLSGESLDVLQQMEKDIEAADNRSTCAEVRVIDKSGEARACEIRVAAPGIGDQGRLYLYVGDITERKRTEDYLKISHENYKRLFETIQHGVYIVSKEGKFLDCNQALLNMLGYNDKEEFLALDLAKDLYGDPEGRKKIQEIFREVGYVEDQEVILKKKSGEELTVLLTSHSIRSETGEVTGYQGMAIDITERKRMENNLRVSHEKYKRLFEGIRDGIYLSSKEGKFLDCNQALLNMLGYNDKEEFLALDLAKDVYRNPEDRKRFREIVEREGYVGDFEVAFKKKSGEELTILLTSYTVRNELGEVSAYEGIMRDITQRKQMERHLVAANEFLNRSIEASPDGIIVTDAKGAVIMYNKAAEALFGYPAGEVTGKRTKVVDPYPKRVTRKIRELIIDGKTGRQGVLPPTEFYVKNKSGEMIETSLSASIIYDDTGEEIGAIAIFKDLSEMVGVKRKLKETQDQLVQSERLAAMGRLTSQIAHELNNPLYGIMNTFELLKAEIPETSKRRKLLDMALQEVARLSTMLKNMLTFSRPDEEMKREVEMNHFLEGILMLMEKQLAESGIELVAEFDKAIPPIRVSPNQMRQVFLNIVKNAMEAMPHGGTLNVITQCDGGALRVTVNDTGVGMTEEVKERIFDAFYTTKEQVRGVGLGLSVCYGIIRDHGGDIEVESSPGKGSTFSVTLPVP